MKKIVCLCLLLALVFSMTACGTKNNVEPETPTQNQDFVTRPSEEDQEIEDPIPMATMPIEDGDKTDSLYEDDSFSYQLLIKQIESMKSEGTQRKEIAQLLTRINGKIVDIYNTDVDFYILTNRALYRLAHMGQQLDVIPIDASDHCGIFAIYENIIILLSNDGKYDLFGFDASKDEWCEYEFPVYSTNNPVSVSVCAGMSLFESSIYLNYHSNPALEDQVSFVADIYEFVSGDNGIAINKESEKNRFPLINVEGKKFKAFYTSQSADSLGLGLFENGDVHVTEMRFGTMWEERGMYVYDNCFSGVERIFTTNSTDRYYGIKTGINDKIYLYVIDYDRDIGYFLTEKEFNIPSAISADQIVGIYDLHLGNDTYYVEMIDGSYLLFDNSRIQLPESITMEEYDMTTMQFPGTGFTPELKMDLVTAVYVCDFRQNNFYSTHQHKIFGTGILCGYTVYLMDDHHLYIHR